MSTFPKPPEIFNQRYELLEYLGSGGVGTVFKAMQIDAQREIALKIMRKEFSDNEEFKQRFIREARALSQLSHQGIVTVYHIGVSDLGLAYMAMELIQGRSLRQVLNDSDKISALRALDIAMHIADALECVHANGIVHRDLKPENIILLDTPAPDSIKLIDFGLARMDDEQKLTQSGVLIGTVNYMSPEQCKGKKADARSDIYSLCACLYEMLSGTKLYEADNPVGVMYKHMNDPIPLLGRKQLDRFDESINILLQKGLAKQAEDRFQTMSELLKSMHELHTTLAAVEPAKPSQTQFSKTAIPALAGIGIVALLAGIVIQLKSHNPLKPQLTGSAATDESARKQVRPVSPSSSIVLLREASRLFNTDPNKGRVFLDDILKSKNLKTRARIMILCRRATYENSQKCIAFSAEAVRLAKQELAKENDTDSNHLYFASMYTYANCLFSQSQYAKVIKVCESLLQEDRTPTGSGQSRLSSGIAAPASAELLHLAACAAIKMNDLKLANQFVDRLAKFDYGGFHSASRVGDLLFTLKREKDIEKFINLIVIGTNNENAIVYEYETMMDFTGLCIIARQCTNHKNWRLAELALNKAQALSDWIRVKIPDAGGVRWQLGIEKAKFFLARGQQDEARKVLKKVAAEWLKYNENLQPLQYMKNNPRGLIQFLLSNELDSEADQVIDRCLEKFDKYAPYLDVPFESNFGFDNNKTDFLNRLEPFKNDPHVAALIEKVKSMPPPKV